jgi:hypothetical protein
VLFWFVGMAIVSVGFVFRDPGFDYRLVVVGALVPLLDGLTGGVWIFHSIVTTIAVLVVVMLATIGRRQLRQTLLGLPIGMFLTLVFDGAWSDTDAFWWPFTGWTFADEPLLVVARGWWSVVLELAGVAICVQLWRLNGLGSGARRRRFLRDGRLSTRPVGP